MDYIKHYDVLIERAKERTLDHSVYTETHHILPRCCGGDNSPDNLAVLLPEEHVVAHLLLVKIHPHNHKLAHAANMMCSCISNNKEYKWVRVRHAKGVSERMKGRKLSDEHKRKIGLAHKGKTVSQETRDKLSQVDRSYMRTDSYRKRMSDVKTGFLHTDETKHLLSLQKRGEGNPFYGKTHTDSTLAKISECSSNSRWVTDGNEERLVNLSEVDKYLQTGFARGRLSTTCPHCGKVGSGGNMKRYHFDNCKLNP